MKKPNDLYPDLNSLKGIVAPEILHAIVAASRLLREAGIPHALAGGLAVGAHGYPRTTNDVDFLVGDEAFVQHSGGLVTLKVPLIAIGQVRIDFISFVEVGTEVAHLRPAVEHPLMSGEIPVVPMSVLVYMKLKAGRQKDIADVVELLKRGKIEIEAIDRYLAAYAPEQVPRWERARRLAAEEE